MPFADISHVLLDAGRKYLIALKRLGIEPEGCLWVRMNGEEFTRLWIIWSGIDQVGPLAMTSLLFDAYKKAALPPEVNPFHVTLLSTDQPIVIHVLEACKHAELGKNPDRVYSLGVAEDPNDDFFKFRASWIYRLPRKKKKGSVALKEWRKFESRVAALAA